MDGVFLIPKIIHYIWFGGSALPSDVKCCIASWREHCPDYEIVRWDESNFNIDSNRYVREAYEKRRWAFVSDYVRLYALVTYGGIYLDTDVELIKPLDPLLANNAFSGFESSSAVCTCVLGCEKGFPLFESFLNSYEKRPFVLSSGEQDLTTNVARLTRFMEARGLQKDGSFQVIDDLARYPSFWFSPKNQDTGELDLRAETVAIHHFDGSWIDETEKEILRKRQLLIKKHPNVNPLLLGFFVRVGHGLKKGDFSPLLNMLRLSLKSLHHRIDKS